MERLLREADEKTQKAIREAIKKATERYDVGSDGWCLAVHFGVEDVLGAYDQKEINGFGVRLTKLEADETGHHEFVTIYF
jgi:hypothetical protein